jgi:hypothetical protein
VRKRLKPFSCALGLFPTRLKPGVNEKSGEHRIARKRDAPVLPLFALFSPVKLINLFL